MRSNRRIQRIHQIRNVPRDMIWSSSNQMLNPFPTMSMCVVLLHFAHVWTEEDFAPHSILKIAKNLKPIG